MKANEAPEKIYLEKVYPDNGILPNGLNYNQSPNDIEYTRTDAFIEKAKTFIYNHIDGSGLHLNYILKEFENYMKGEEV